jgi:toxin ParE1/3/4
VTSLVIRPEAESDLYDAYSWYEVHSAGLGDKFLDSVHVVLQSIRENPRRFPEVLADPQTPVRRALIKKFPYGVYFALSEAGKVVSVLACMHARQEPSSWIRRVR